MGVAGASQFRPAKVKVSAQGVPCLVAEQGLTASAIVEACGIVHLNGAVPSRHVCGHAAAAARGV
ncbi:hypothetical protein Wenmar_02456 [Wenxinia marina DSM 24838]|uniref:Uncharacterized protein n=1 Tax=Wenxinia marina DSM 24838 TaxID=1123501 RepID=A0A0D0PBE3_9RHOB|nr:hypothetical protein Wenmar_02456 [Wenxinia marina DSM 24838]